MSSTFAIHEIALNRILAALPGEELQQLKPYLTRVRLVSQQVLLEHKHRIEHAFFLEEGVVSLVAGSTWPGSVFQVAMIGPEGMVGCQGLLDTGAGSSTMAVVATAGLAYRVSIADLRVVVQQCPALHAASMKAIETLLDQTMQTAAFTAGSTLEERCVRWLLMAHDRVEGPDLIVTHESISGHLGVRRSGITLVMAALQAANLIRIGRGRITILDRRGLEQKISKSAWAVDGAAMGPAGGSPRASPPSHAASSGALS